MSQCKTNYDESSRVQSNQLLSKYDETGIGSPTSGEEIREPQSLKKQTTNRRKKVEEGLKNRRDKKLSSKLSMDTQTVKYFKRGGVHQKKTRGAARKI